MRTIKFRIWNVYEKEMLDDVHFFTDDFTDMLNEFFNYYQNVVDDDEKLIFMQYTGLRDKNHREIYEGDIVRFENGKLGKIVWSKKDAGFAVKVDGELVFFDSDIDADNIEVVGNIFENPELLEKLYEN